MSGSDVTGWAGFLPNHIPGVQVLDRLLRAGWPEATVAPGLMAEAARFLPALFDEGPKGETARAFLIREMAQDRAGVLARMSFLRSAMRDVALHGDLILPDPDAFMARSETFTLFNYDLALDVTEASLAATRPWVGYVATLTRTEAPYLLPLVELPDAAMVLEPGGNNGTFARALIADKKIARHVVLDLPAVCALGRALPPAAGLSFLPEDMRRGDWAAVAGFAPDAVVFKSVLHDWPEDAAQSLLGHALAALAPGGQIVIAERDVFHGMTGGTAMDYANLVFAAFYRPLEVYQRMLRALCPDLIIRVARTVIDTDWYVLSARRAA
mgnify:CR=1 FL=1